MWEYFFDEPYHPSDTIQNLTIFDSTDSQGIIHITQHARAINPIESTLYLLDTARYWIDTVNHYVYGPGIHTDSTLIYKLNGRKGEKWIDTLHHEAVKILEKWKGTILGKTTEFMSFSYYTIGDINDTLSWQDLVVKTIADGFGLVYLGGGESMGEISLTGALINNTLYGCILLSQSNKNETIYL